MKGANFLPSEAPRAKVLAGLGAVWQLARRRPRSAVWLFMVVVATSASGITGCWWWTVGVGVLLTCTTLRLARDLSPGADWRRWRIIDVSDWRLRWLAWKTLWTWRLTSKRLGLFVSRKLSNGGERLKYTKMLAIVEIPAGLQITLRLPKGIDPQVVLGAEGRLTTQFGYEVSATKTTATEVVLHVKTRDPLAGDRAAHLTSHEPEPWGGL